MRGSSKFGLPTLILWSQMGRKQECSKKRQEICGQRLLLCLNTGKCLRRVSHRDKEIARDLNCILANISVR